MKDDNTPDTKQEIRAEFQGKDKNDLARPENRETPMPSEVPLLPMLTNESAVEYKAMLLWLVQKKKKRSFRKVATALGISDFKVRNLAKKHDWEARGKELGAQVARRAFSVYLEKCVSPGSLDELKTVAPNAPFDLLSALARRSPKKLEVIRPRLVPDEKVSPAVAVMAEHVAEAEAQIVAETDGAKRKKAIQDQQKIVKAVIGRGVEALKDGSMKISARDMKSFLELEQVVMGFTTDTEGVARGVESVRVKFARDQGDDLLVALRKDHMDQATILQGLWDQREQAKLHDEQTEQERKRLMEELGQ